MLCVTFYFHSSSLGTWGASTSVRARRAEHGAGVAPGAQARLAQVPGGGMEEHARHGEFDAHAALGAEKLAILDEADDVLDTGAVQLDERVDLVLVGGRERTRPR